MAAGLGLADMLVEGCGLAGAPNGGILTVQGPAPSTGGGSVASGVIPVREQHATHNQLVQGAPNAAATVTLPAPGLLLFQYITHIRIVRVATAALAGAAILTLTTTNLNNRNWRVGNAMAAGGTQIDMDQDFAHPLKAAASNTAVTIVGPIPGAAVSWDIEVDYYVAP